jgi:hypothetical protein
MELVVSKSGRYRITSVTLSQDAAEDCYNLLPTLLHGPQTRAIREAIIPHSSDAARRCL